MPDVLFIIAYIGFEKEEGIEKKVRLIPIVNSQIDNISVVILHGQDCCKYNERDQ